MKKQQAYNYSRSAVKFLGELSDTLLSVAEIEPRAAETLKQLPYVIELLKTAPKFMLPEGGRYTDDKNLHGLDETKRIQLPFPTTILEYHTDCHRMEPDQHLSTKRIVIAIESVENDGILVVPVVYIDSMAGWYPYPTALMPSTGYLDRSADASGVRILCNVPNEGAREASGNVGADYGEELGVLLSFLNILQCNNVATEKLKAKPLSKSQRRKNALPFDSYHVLTIGSVGTRAGHSGAIGVGRSKRTHVRRGHIRRLLGGKKTTWVNSCIINPNVVGGGVIKKDYKLKE